MPLPVVAGQGVHSHKHVEQMQDVGLNGAVMIELYGKGMS